MINNTNGNKVASQIESLVKANRYTMSGVGYGYMMRDPNVNGIMIQKSKDGSCIEILVGTL